MEDLFLKIMLTAFIIGAAPGCYIKIRGNKEPETTLDFVAISVIFLAGIIVIVSGLLSVWLD